MQGVFHDADKKVLVANDAHKMVVIKDPTIKKTFIQDVTGKVVGLGKEIDAKYPDYSVVIPESAPIKQKVNVQQMLDETAGLAGSTSGLVLGFAGVGPVTTVPTTAGSAGVGSAGCTPNSPNNA